VRIVKMASWWQVCAIVAVLAGAVFWAALLDVPVTVRGKGVLLSVHGVAEITMPSRGTITQFLVHDGTELKVGDLVAQVAQPETAMQLATKEAMLREAKDRLARHTDLNARTNAAQRVSDKVRRQEAETRIALLTGEFTMLQDRDRNLRDLASKGMMARDQMLANQAKLHEVEISIGGARAEIAGLTAQAELAGLQQERDLSTITDDISRLTVETTELAKLLTGQTEIRSPFAGHVVEMKAQAGNLFEAGAPLMTVLRDDDADPTTGALQAIAYISPADGKKVKPGDAVLVAPSSVETSEFGKLRGTVLSIAETPATTAGMMNALKNDQMVKTLSADGAPFMALIALQPAPANKSGYAWSSSQGPDRMLTGGTVADTEIVVQERRLLGIVIPPLARLFRTQ
jgi:HlyD family secretion protein